jgi:transcriptional regulator with XRE-family HTH domain
MEFTNRPHASSQTNAPTQKKSAGGVLTAGATIPHRTLLGAGAGFTCPGRVGEAEEGKESMRTGMSGADRFDGPFANSAVKLPQALPVRPLHIRLVALQDAGDGRLSQADGVADLRLGQPCAQKVINQFTPVHDMDYRQTDTLCNRQTDMGMWLYRFIDMKTLGQRLKEARKAVGLTQPEVARKVGLSQPQLSELENDHYKSSSLVPALADLYGVDALWLAEGKGRKERPGNSSHVVAEPHSAYEAGGSDGETFAVGSAEQLLRDWKSLPADWQYYLCHKARELSEAAHGLPEIVKQSMRPIRDENAYRDWEARIEAAMREGELHTLTTELRRGDILEVVSDTAKKTGSDK